MHTYPTKSPMLVLSKAHDARALTWVSNGSEWAGREQNMSRTAGVKCYITWLKACQCD